jgi:hypothetical protein
MHARLFKQTIVILGGMLLTCPVRAQVWWPQWALNPQHTGQVNVAGQPLNNILANTIYDPLVPAEMAATGGELLAHYQVPLIDSSTIYMEFKSDTYNKNTYSTETWGENAFQWQNGQFVQIWSFTSDWKAPGSQADFWEPVFHGVLANGYIYVPGAGGTLFKLNTSTGAVVSRINPFGIEIDPTIIVAGVPTTDGNGNIYYNAIQQFNTGTGISFYQHDIVDSWLVKVTFNDSAAKASYSILVTKTAAGSLPSPQPNDQCLGFFDQRLAMAAKPHGGSPWFDVRNDEASFERRACDWT